jgi:hypothetical protein
VVLVVGGGGRFTTGVTGAVVDVFGGLLRGVAMMVAGVNVRSVDGMAVLTPPAPFPETTPPPNGVDAANDPSGPPATDPPPPELAAPPPGAPVAPLAPDDPGLPGSEGTFGTVKGRDAAWMLGAERCPEPTSNPATTSRSAAASALVAATTRS